MTAQDLGSLIALMICSFLMLVGAGLTLRAALDQGVSGLWKCTAVYTVIAASFLALHLTLGFSLEL